MKSFKNMSKISSVCSLTASLCLIAENCAWAAAPTAAYEPSIKTVFIITIIIGIVMGFMLAGFARRSAYLSEHRREKYKKTYGDTFMPDVLEKISPLSGSIESQKQVAAAVSNLLNQKVEEKVSTLKQELTQEYGKIIDEKNKTEAELRVKYKNTVAEKKQTESIVRSIAEGLVVVNNKGEVLLMNPTAEKLLGVNKENKLGKPLLENVKNEQLFSLTKNISGGEKKEIELFSKDDSTKKVLRSSSAVIEDESGKTIGMVSVLSDITKQKALDLMKSDFVSNVSHELRHPIGAIKQSLSVILNGSAGPLTEHQSKFLSNAQRNLERLGTLIDDLLDLAKLEARKMPLKTEPCSVEKLIDETCETLGTWAKSKSIKIEKNIARNLPQTNLDQNKIIQVITNLVGNAIKFAPKDGKIIVEAKLVAANSKIEVSVIDTGVGIEKENLEKVFDKFVQVGERTSSDMAGTGLGLSIAKEIIELHGGKIWAESEKGCGAKFVFTLPITL